MVIQLSAPPPQTKITCYPYAVFKHFIAIVTAFMALYSPAWQNSTMKQLEVALLSRGFQKPVYISLNIKWFGC